jgi:hypothetical protein
MMNKGKKGDEIKGRTPLFASKKLRDETCNIQLREGCAHFNILLYQVTNALIVISSVAFKFVVVSLAAKNHEMGLDMRQGRKKFTIYIYIYINHRVLPT